MPCCSAFFSPSHITARLFAITTLLLTPCYFASHCYTLLLSLLHLHALPSRLATLPCYYAIMPRVHALLLYLVVCHALLFTFSLGTSCHTPIVARLHALLFYFVSWNSLPTLLCKWRSSKQQQQQVSSNNIGKFLFQIF